MKPRTSATSRTESMNHKFEMKNKIIHCLWIKVTIVIESNNVYDD